ncbi:hypothetical protein BC940DRAFT_363485 [Gongronella butleri]|nr:hypothetical protein BC940DRAFT_363485 [Gongronella butleri]
MWQRPTSPTTPRAPTVIATERPVANNGDPIHLPDGTIIFNTERPSARRDGSIRIQTESPTPPRRPSSESLNSTASSASNSSRDDRRISVMDRDIVSGRIGFKLINPDPDIEESSDEGDDEHDDDKNDEKEDPGKLAPSPVPPSPLPASPSPILPFASGQSDTEATPSASDDAASVQMTTSTTAPRDSLSTPVPAAMAMPSPASSPIPNAVSAIMATHRVDVERKMSKILVSSSSIRRGTSQSDDGQTEMGEMGENGERAMSASSDPLDVTIQSFDRYASVIEPMPRTTMATTTDTNMPIVSMPSPGSFGPQFPSIQLISTTAIQAADEEACLDRARHAAQQHIDDDDMPNPHDNNHHHPSNVPITTSTSTAQQAPAKPPTPPPKDDDDKDAYKKRMLTTPTRTLKSIRRTSAPMHWLPELNLRHSLFPDFTNFGTVQQQAESQPQPQTTASTSLMSAASPTPAATDNIQFPEPGDSYRPIIKVNRYGLTSPQPVLTESPAASVSASTLPTTTSLLEQQQQQQQNDENHANLGELDATHTGTTTPQHRHSSSSFAQSYTTSQGARNSLDRPLSTLSQLVGNLNDVSNTTAQTSKFNIASYTLTNNPAALKQYSEMARKTNDPLVQLSFAKYLLEVAAFFHPTVGHTENVEEETRDKKQSLEKEAVRWIQRLSELGIPEAALMEATWIEDQTHGYKGKNDKKCDRLYRLAVGANLPEACFRLAARLEKANPISSEALFLNQRAAELNYPPAIYKMAKVYLHGELGQAQNVRYGMEILMSAVHAATKTCNEPPYVLALILTNKYSKLAVPTELASCYGTLADVITYMEMSANLGNVGAKNRAGHIYEHGSYDVPMNFEKAFLYYKEAAEQGHKQSMLALSRLYNGGCHGPNDHDEQHRLDNDTSGWLASHDRDTEKAFYWCQRAARGRLPDALFVLGWYYEIGLGVPRSYEYSVDCYEQAAQLGQLDAQQRMSMANSLTRQQHRESTNSSRFSRDMNMMTIKNKLFAFSLSRNS